MILCNEVVTLFNARFDKERDCTVYERTILNGVHSFSTMKSTVDTNGLKAANTTTIRIPVSVDAEGKAYIAPDGYTAADDVSGYFTLNEGDIIVPGIIAPLPSDETLAGIRRIHGAVTILGVTDSSRAPKAPHWKVVGS